MEKKFIYIFSEEDKELLLQHGFYLMKSDDVQEVYVFENKNSSVLDDYEIQYVPSDVLTFNMPERKSPKRGLRWKKS